MNLNLVCMIIAITALIIFGIHRENDIYTSRDEHALDLCFYNIEARSPKMNIDYSNYQVQETSEDHFTISLFAYKQGDATVTEYECLVEDEKVKLLHEAREDVIKTA